MKITTNKGFTLAEVLLTLVTIGIVAAITIPLFVQIYKDQVTSAQLKKTFGILSQAVRMAEAHNGEIDDWDLGEADTPEGGLKLYNYLVPELIRYKDCKGEQGCFADNYLTLQGTAGSYQPSKWNNCARGILNNGVPFVIWSGGTGGDSPMGSDIYGMIRVDINGESKPNRYGYDYFGYVIKKQGLIPVGTTSNEVNLYCNPFGSNAENGIGCTAWVIYKKNFDYKHKNISW